MEATKPQKEINKSTKSTAKKAKKKVAKKRVIKKHTIKSEKLQQPIIQGTHDAKFQRQIKEFGDAFFKPSNNEQSTQQKPNDEQPKIEETKASIATPIKESKVSLEARLDMINKSLKTEYAKLAVFVVALASAIFLHIKKKNLFPDLVFDVIMAYVALLICGTVMKIYMLSTAKKALSGENEWVIESMRIIHTDENGKQSSMEINDNIPKEAEYEKWT